MKWNPALLIQNLILSSQMIESSILFQGDIVHVRKYNFRDKCIFWRLSFKNQVQSSWMNEKMGSTN
jgi:hypothetical protein